MPSDLLDSPLVGYDQDAVDAAVDLVRSHCGWHIAPSIEETVTLDGSGGPLLILPSLRITAVTSVTENGYTLLSTAYSWSSNGVVERDGWWTSRRGAITVTFTHGHEECPPAVRAVIARVAKAGLVPERLKSQTDTKGPFSRSRTFVDAGSSSTGALDEYGISALMPYVLPTRP